MCTIVEICPNGPGQQSVIGISGPDRVLFTINRQLLKADTCEKDPAVPNQIEDKDGLLCCPMEFPRPRNPTRNGTYILGIQSRVAKGKKDVFRSDLSILLILFYLNFIELRKMVLHIIKLPFGINPCPLSFAMDSSTVIAFILIVGLKWAGVLWLVDNFFSF